MQSAGLEKVETAKKNGSWNFLDDIEDIIVPEDLKDALNENENTSKNFEAFGNSNKKQILYWIASAKRQETRNKRIQKIIEAALRNKTPFN